MDASSFTCASECFFDLQVSAGGVPCCVYFIELNAHQVVEVYAAAVPNDARQLPAFP